MNTNVDFYEVFASSYEAFYADVDAPEAVRQWLMFLEDKGFVPPRAKRLSRPLTLLDIGCGPGCHLRPWQQAGFHLSGLDASPSMLRLAAHNAAAGVGTDVPLYCADLRDTTSVAPLAERFDVAVSHFNFLNLIAPADLEAVFRTVASVLGVNGFWATDLSVAVPEQLAREMDPVGTSIEIRLLGQEPAEIPNCVRVRWEIHGQFFYELYWMHPLDTLRAAAGIAQLDGMRVAGWTPEDRRTPWHPTLSDPRLLLVFSRSAEL